MSGGNLLPIPIEPSEDTLRMMDEKFKPVSDDRFMYSLQQKKWSIEQVSSFTSHLEISYTYTKREYDRILVLKETYNLDYFNDHQKYFSIAVELLSKMRSTLSAYKKIVNGFPPKKKRGKHPRKEVSAYNRTPLFNGEYSQDCFGWDVYADDAAKRMFDELNRYLQLSKECLGTCLSIIDDEKAIRANPDQALPRYRRSYDRSVKGNQQLILLLEENNVPIGHDLVKAMEDAEDVMQLIAELFHTLTSSEFNFFCACKAIHDGRQAGLTPNEIAAFGIERKEAALRLRLLLSHIMELAEQRDDVIGWEGMLNGKFVMHLLFWCGWDGSKNESMLKCVVDGCRGVIGVVKMGAVQRWKRKLAPLANALIKEQQDRFNQDMDAFVDSFSDEPSLMTN